MKFFIRIAIVVLLFFAGLSSYGEITPPKYYYGLNDVVAHTQDGNRLTVVAMSPTSVQLELFNANGYASTSTTITVETSKATEVFVGKDIAQKGLLSTTMGGPLCVLVEFDPKAFGVTVLHGLHPCPRPAASPAEKPPQ